MADAATHEVGIACRPCKQFVVARTNHSADKIGLRVLFYSECPFADEVVNQFLANHAGHLLGIEAKSHLAANGYSQFANVS